MTRLYYDRFINLTVDSLVIENLDVVFKIEKTDKPQPNKARLEIYNLNGDHRGELLRQHGVRADRTTRRPVHVELDVGYRDEHGSIFKGDLANLEVKEDRADLIVLIEGEDGGHSWRTANISRSFVARTPLATVIKACADAMGLGLGNTAEQAANASVFNLGRTMPHGIALSGMARDALDRVLGSCDLGWSIQNGNIQILGADEALRQAAIKISPSTGLVGSPTEAVTADVVPTKGARVKTNNSVGVKALLNPGYFPRRKVQLESRSYSGNYQIKDVTFQGSTFAQEWYADMKVVPYGA